MGGQQFCQDGVVMDCRRLNQIIHFNPDAGIIEVEAGMEWPELVEYLQPTAWSIVQKQTGADHLTLGGAVAANIHGRGLSMRPLVQDIESLTIVDALGEIVVCSRTTNPSYFTHVVGGYGMFGIVYSVRLRLARRQNLRRVVRQVHAHDLISSFEKLIADFPLWRLAVRDR